MGKTNESDVKKSDVCQHCLRAAAKYPNSVRKSRMWLVKAVRQTFNLSNRVDK